MQEENGIRLGDYVFVSKYSDGDLDDPWYIGLLKEMGEDRKGNFYRVGDGCWNHSRFYRHCRKLTREEGEKILSHYDVGSRGLITDIIGEK